MAEAIPAEPGTLMGQVLRATLRRDFGAADDLSGRLNGGRPGWNDDEPAVVEAACELAALRYFRADCDVREITAFVSDMLARVTESKLGAGPLEVEAVIRGALGEKDVSLEGIRRSVLHGIRITVTMDIVYRLSLAGPEIDRLVTDAERMAFARGWDPAPSSVR